MKIAVIHDDFMRRGGAERVALTLFKAFPNADYYTLCYKKELTYEEIRKYDIRASWFQKIAFTEATMKMFFYPMGIWAMKSLNLMNYDAVIISTTFCSKYIKLNPKCILITYCHSPFRLAWYPETYKNITKSSFLKSVMFKLICPLLRKVDKKYALRSNYFIANSKVTLRRINDCYTSNIPTSILPPPIDINQFAINNSYGDYYLVVSRFQPYKKIDLVIDVFNNLPDKKLIIVGTGVQEKELKKRAKNNIEFKGAVDQRQLKSLFASCKALIFPQIEDFGITPLEANASGRPVIAFQEGGVLETMIPYKSAGQPFSAVFFEEQSIPSLHKAIQFFESIEHLVNPSFNRINAERFGETSFIDKVNALVNEVCGNSKFNASKQVEAQAYKKI